jgi:branched-chain amino acid transport system permease protein
VIVCGLVIAGLIGYILLNTRFGKIIRAAADKKEMSEALGINMTWVYVKVFTLGTILGTLGGALVIPAGAAVSEMGVELIVLAFAVVVIGGLGSMKGAFVGALVVGVLKSIAISTYPELEMLTIYIIVIVVLVIKPQGLFGGGRV